MKKLNVLISSILAASLLVAGGAAAGGCKKKTSEHEHTFSSQWSSDRFTHWHEPACKDTDIRGDEAAHEWGTDSKCKVCEMKRANGIEITKTQTVYQMGAASKIKIPVNDIRVNLLKEDGSVDREMMSDEYTLSYYKGKEKLADLNSVDAGSYNIWVEATKEGQVVDSCVVVYVTDVIMGLEKVSGETEQVIGGDHISSTWKFRASLLSGNTLDVGLSDVTVSGFSTFKVTNNSTAIVTYTYVNSLGVSTNRQTQVMYKITQPESGVEVIENTYSYDAITEMSKDKTQLTNANMTGVNEFITVTKVADFQWRSASGKYVEIQGPSLEVEFKGTGLLTINCASTGGSNVSALALIDENGDYVSATYSNSNVTASYDNTVYAINGNSGVTFSFTIYKPGKYTISSVDEVETEEDIIATKRYLRIWSIYAIDVAAKA